MDLESKQMLDSKWITSMTNALSQIPQWENVHNVLVPQLLKAPKGSILKDQFDSFL